MLWLDLMFDVQTRQHPGNPLPPEVLTSISAYYRRATTDAWPMNRLIALVMLLTLAAICAEIVQGENPWWIGWGSIALPAAVLCRPIRAVPNARRLGAGLDAAEEQSRLARAICRDHHMFSLARMLAVLVPQLIAR